MKRQSNNTLGQAEQDQHQQCMDSPEHGQVDGRGDDEADRRAEEGQRRLQVLAAVADYLGKRKRRRR